MAEAAHLRQHAEAGGGRAAAAAGRGRARRGHGGARRARAAPRRPGRDLLAIPPIRAGRCRRPASTGAKARSRSGSTCARPNGRRRKASGCGATARPRWITPRARDLPTKRERADLLTLALAALLVRGGERVTLLGSGLPPRHGRAVLDRLALHHRARRQPARACPAFEPLPRHGQVVLIGDLLAPLDEIHALVARFAATGRQGPSAAGARSGRGDPALRRPRALRRAGARGAAADQPRRDRARGLYRAPGAPSRRARRDRARRRLELSARTAPTGRRTPRCWRSMPRSRRSRLEIARC